jgi:hypothetical protein
VVAYNLIRLGNLLKPAKAAVSDDNLVERPST